MKFEIPYFYCANTDWLDRPHSSPTSILHGIVTNRILWGALWHVLCTTRRPPQPILQAIRQRVHGPVDCWGKCQSTSVTTIIIVYNAFPHRGITHHSWLETTLNILEDVVERLPSLHTRKVHMDPEVTLGDTSHILWRPCNQGAWYMHTPHACHSPWTVSNAVNLSWPVETTLSLHDRRRRC